MQKQLTTQAPAVSQFQFDGQGVRVAIIAGISWWVAGDVCSILGLENVTKALVNLDRDEKTTLPKGKVSNETKGLRAINEPGLYALIFKSRKPEAKSFKRWVTHEVLPAIRKTGRYAVDNYPPMSLDPMAVIEAAEEACKKVGFGPRASQAVAREFGVRIGVPPKLLPVIDPAGQTVYKVTAPGKTTAHSIKARRIALHLTEKALGSKAFPHKTPNAARCAIYQMEHGQSLTTSNIEAVNAVLGNDPANTGETLDVPVAVSLINRFPHIPDAYALDLHFARFAASEKERLMPAKRLAMDVFEEWVG